MQATSGQKLTMGKMLKGLLGQSDFNKLCLGIRVEIIGGDVLQVHVPAKNYAAEFAIQHSDDFAVAAEFALGQPIRKVNVLSAG